MKALALPPIILSPALRVTACQYECNIFPGKALFFLSMAATLPNRHCCCLTANVTPHSIGNIRKLNMKKERHSTGYLINVVESRMIEVVAYAGSQEDQRFQVADFVR